MRSGRVYVIFVETKRYADKSRRRETMQLPEEFCSRMKHMLGAEYDRFLASYDEPRYRGLRVNTLRITPEEFAAKAPFPVKPIPWTDNGFFYDNDVFPARHPYYAAGLYYLQEPSAMTPASRIPVKPGDRVLDLCAAPGGKSTELAARLAGKGLLVANDISNARAKALLRNLELFGTARLLVTNETPEALAQRFPSCFNAIQVDAPCSGEGMFRKDPAAAELWNLGKVRQCAAVQKSILERAWEMLMPGGYLMYSTCTFAPEENEQIISWALNRFPDAELMEIPDRYEGFSPGHPEWADGDPRLARCIRIWPHCMAGEGHFMALLQKQSEGMTYLEEIGADFQAAARPALLEEELPAEQETISRKKKKKQGKKSSRQSENQTRGGAAGPDGEELRQLEDFLADVEGIGISDIQQYGGKAYLTSPLPGSIRGMNFLRSGCFVGEWKKNRFEPAQPLAMLLSASRFANAWSMPAEDGRIAKYLRGETITLDEEEIAAGTLKNGWVLVCVEDYPLGWAKYAGGVLKNKYPATWRK